MFFVIYFFFFSVMFLFKRFSGSIESSDSCFFMPCAPQSISETDQAGALFIGLFLFLAVEIVIPLYKILKMRYRDDENFRLMVDRRFQAGVIRRVVGEATGNTPGVPLRSMSRVNSGIELEEGFAAVSRRDTSTANAVSSGEGL